MWNIPLQKWLDTIPRLYETENIPFANKNIYLHFHIGDCHWYVAEYDGEDLFFGYAILWGNIHFAEWGYFSFEEMKDAKIDQWLGLEIQCDENWTVRKASEVENIKNI